MPINDNLPYREMPSYTRNGGRFYTIIKIPKSLENKVRIIHHNFGTLEL